MSFSLMRYMLKYLEMKYQCSQIKHKKMCVCLCVCVCMHVVGDKTGKAVCSKNVKGFRMPKVLGTSGGFDF